MPPRDLRGEEIPAGKVRRRLEYHALADDGSPHWMALFGDGATEVSTSIGDGRGELALTVADGVGGYAFPQFDPDSFREVRLGVAFHDGLGEGNEVALGFADSISDPKNGVTLQQSSGREDSRPAQLVRLDGGDRSVAGNVGSLVSGPEGATGGTDVCALVEVRIRPFERGETVAFGGAGRGDVAHEASEQAYGFSSPMLPFLQIDTTPAGTTDTVGLAKAWLELLHN